jgi:hypothetical protein
MTVSHVTRQRTDSIIQDFKVQEVWSKNIQNSDENDNSTVSNICYCRLKRLYSYWACHVRRSFVFNNFIIWYGSWSQLMHVSVTKIRNKHCTPPEYFGHSRDRPSWGTFLRIATRVAETCRRYILSIKYSLRLYTLMVLIYLIAQCMVMIV